MIVNSLRTMRSAFRELLSLRRSTMKRTPRYFTLPFALFLALFLTLPTMTGCEIRQSFGINKHHPHKGGRPHHNHHDHCGCGNHHGPRGHRPPWASSGDADHDHDPGPGPRSGPRATVTTAGFINARTTRINTLEHAPKSPPRNNSASRVSRGTPKALPAARKLPPVNKPLRKAPARKK